MVSNGLPAAMGADPTTPPTVPAAAVTQTPAPSGTVLTPDQVRAWRRRIQAALDATKPAIDTGKVNVARYRGQYLPGTPASDQVLVPTDFYYIEAKRAQLFYRLPDVFLKPEQPGLEDAAIVFQAAINKKIGPAGVNVLPTVQQVIFDVLCPTGFGAAAVGYQTVVDPQQPTTPIQVGEEPDPTVPAVPGMPPPTRPVMAEAPNIVASWYFAEHLAPGDLIVPPEFVGMDFDKAAYLGQRFREDVPDDSPGGSARTDDDRRLTPIPGSGQAALRKQRTGTELWYKAHLFDPDVQHPDKIRMFKVYDDDLDSAPVEVKDHPHQRYATPAGQLKAGMRGYPIAPLTLRYVSDTWMAPSDCSMARNTADELSKGRTQMLQARDRNMPQWGYDSTRVDPDVRAKIEKNEIGAGIGFNGPGQDATWPIIKGDSPRETYAFNDVAQQDLARTWRMGSNQIGVLDDKNRTATEQQITQSAAQEASEADRSVILAWYVNKVIAKFASLLQLYATEQEFVELVGADAQRLTAIPPQVQQQAQQSGQDARALVPWNKDTIQGEFAFSAKPNSQLFIDAAQEKKQLMDLYSFFANDPTVNRAELTRAILARYGFDPSKLMQQPPAKQSAPPNVSVAVKGDDFNPQMPQSPIVLDALNKLGIPIDPAAIQAAHQIAALIPPAITPSAHGHGAPPDASHPGAVAQAEPLLKHPAVQTGAMQGTGVHAPLGAGGHP